VLKKLRQASPFPVNHFPPALRAWSEIMSDSISGRERVFKLPGLGVSGRVAREQTKNEALTAELQAALTREETLLRERRDLLKRQDMLALEFEHRLVNSLQLIVSLLSLQSRGTTPEVAAQLAIAGRRVAAFGHVHRRLHILDHQECVEFKRYLQHLCEDLSDLLLWGRAGCTIAVEGAQIEIPTAFAIPLGFIVNEMITNSAKYAEGNIIVRLETKPIIGHSLSVSDDGPGLPQGFDPANSKGLGMKIIVSLLKQIGGELQFERGENGRGTCFTVRFRLPTR
jgi:two-component sensor histidine kinase